MVVVVVVVVVVTVVVVVVVVVVGGTVVVTLPMLQKAVYFKLLTILLGRTQILCSIIPNQLINCKTQKTSI